MEDAVQHGASRSQVESRYCDLVNQSRIAHAHVERGCGQRKKTGEVSGVLIFTGSVCTVLLKSITPSPLINPLCLTFI